MANITDKMLRKIAEDIGISDRNLIHLGLGLGFTAKEVAQYSKTNKSGARVTTKGTTNMLHDWSRKTPKKEKVRILGKALGTFGLDFGATAADDQFKVSHRMETPALHVQSGGGLRINGTTAGTYLEMTFDEATDRFTITRYVAGGQTKQNTTSFT